MKDNQQANCQTAADTAEAEEVKAATEFGKFKDAKALLDAYKELEAEFTRRSQRLKELEASNGQGAPAADTPAAVNGTAPSQEGETGGVQAPLSDEIKNAVIEEYLSDVLAKRQVPFVTGGGAVAAKRRTPTTLKEAGALAGKLFNNRED